MASWVSTYTPWAFGMRARYRWDLILRPFTHYKGQFRTYQLSEVAQREEWQNDVEASRQSYPSGPVNNALFEITNRDYQDAASKAVLPEIPKSSIQTLAGLVKEGHFELADKIRIELVEMGMEIPLDFIYEDAAKSVFQWPNPQNHSQVFANWLALVPNARDSRKRRPFQDICAFLFKTPQMHLPLIAEFGVICASKGYGNIAEEVVSVFIQHSESSSAARFLKNIEDAKRWYSRTVLHLPTSVLEAVSELHVPETPPIADPHPEPLDTSLFEDEDTSDDYDFVTAKRPELNRTSAEALAATVVDGHYHSAKHMLDELIALGVKIPKSYIYEKPAIAALTSRSETHLSDFTAWFSLIPDSHVSRQRRFTDLRRIMFRSPATNMELIMRFGIICASKGYGDRTEKQLTRVIMRHADPSVSMKFLQDFEAACAHYWQTNFPFRAHYVLRNVFKAFRGQAIRNYAMAGYFHEAMSLLPVDDNEFTLSPHTYEVVLRQLMLDHSKDEKKDDYIRTVYDRLQLIRAKTELHSSVTVEEDAEENLAYLETLIEENNTAPWPFDIALPQALRRLGRDLRSSNFPPHPFIILDIMEAYLATGRTRALLIIRKRARRSLHRNAAVWALAEMMYSFKHRDYKATLQTFVDNFHLTGVPRDAVISVLAKSAYRPVDDMMLGKAWPSSVHASVVWHALVALCKGIQPLERFYQELLSYARRPAAEQERSSYTNAPVLNPPPSWKHPVDASVFTPFVRGFAWKAGPGRAALVLNDMMELGIPPDVYQLTVLAGQYAALGDVARTFAILDRMEQNNPVVKEELKHDDVAGQRTSGFRFPRPNIVTYTSLMRGFVEAGCLEAAQQVEKRMRERIGYQRGSNAKTDRVYRMLKVLQDQQEKLSSGVCFVFLSSLIVNYTHSISIRHIHKIMETTCCLYPVQGLSTQTGLVASSRLQR